MGKSGSKLGKAGILARPFRVTDGRRFRLSSIDPGDTRGVDSKKRAKERLARDIELLRDLQEKLYAQDRWALLLVFQAMDAAGKDSTIKHVMSGVNPQGCQVYSFKAPSDEELDHDFLWRTTCRLPERGRIGIFNRSYYEEVLVVRVHPELLARQRLPPALVTRGIWQERYEDINAFERYLARNGVVVRKFFLHVSPEEQRQRFLERLDEPRKNWKFSLADVRERRHWAEYMAAYEDVIRRTSSPHAPWYVVPADHKWFTRLVVVSAILDALSSLDLAFPEVEPGRLRELDAARVALADEVLPAVAQPAPRRRGSA
ncbi:MAG TPA: polyphosphate kinase 2 family protein [Methylomirabilota bacterium]|jgi:PPK2 family polyphosphate:nucleotide phosphotransferase|nr:polyphosphate kinase 2 family protein [Methylomirabilota bacterium]